jgi:hypothetical protein
MELDPVIGKIANVMDLELLHVGSLLENEGQI